MLFPPMTLPTFPTATTAATVRVEHKGQPALVPAILAHLTATPGGREGMVVIGHAVDAETASTPA